MATRPRRADGPEAIEWTAEFSASRPSGLRLSVSQIVGEREAEWAVFDADGDRVGGGTTDNGAAASMRAAERRVRQLERNPIV